VARGPIRPGVAVFSGGGTGGHLYPALALADALGTLRPDVAPFFVGAARGLEARILPEKNLPHQLLPVRGFRRGRILENVAVLWALIRSLALTGELFCRIRPHLVVVTGGYAGGPAGIVAGLMGIPLALQEQNARPGFTTRVLSRWAMQVHLAFPEARDALPPAGRTRSRISGNPVREMVPPDPGAARARFRLEPGSRVVLVVGGSQGSQALNQAVQEAVEAVEAGHVQRPDDLQILWASGPEHLSGVRRRMEELGGPDWVRVLGYIEDMPLALGIATMAVSRAGAMATSEFLAWGIPAILVPLPTAAADHQSRNAESLAAAGAGLHLAEAELSGESLWSALTSLLSTPGALEGMAEAARRRGRPHATRQIAEALAEHLPPLRPGRAGSGREEAP
jgi:UDP-N-acetylglucosamine--N-acetylmuramyl-(pentapeptide) pyrophosphoryl-undecaprenol N-acetylglucosamine transferase